MEEIYTEINNILDSLEEERTFFKNHPSTKDVMNNPNSNDKEIIKSFKDNYLAEKTYELTINNYEFNSAWSLLTYEERKAVISLLKSKNQNELASKLEEKIVIFEDLTDESEDLLQQLVSTVEWQTLVKALKLTNDWSDYDSKEILTRICSSVPKQKAYEIQEDYEFIGPVRFSDVQESRKALCDAVKKIYGL